MNWASETREPPWSQGIMAGPVPENSSRGSAWWVGLFALVVAGAAVLPYWHARISHPNEPPSVSVLYRDRAGDVQYFPFVAALARGEFREFSIREAAGTRVLSFPFASLGLHAGCFRSLGPLAGFVTADALVAVAYYLLLVAFFRAAGIAPTASAGFALLPACHFTPVLTVGLREQTLPLIAPLWGERFPRPFVSEVFVLAGLVALALIVVRGRSARSVGTWAVLGAVLALVVQSDIHSAVPLAGGAALVLGWVAGRSPGRAGRAGLAALVPFALLGSPFVIQRLAEHPDLPVRFGVFPVPRLRPLFDLQEPLHAIPYLAILACASLATWTRRAAIDQRDGAGRARSWQRLWLLLGIVVVLAHLAMPLSSVVLGRAIQVFQFPIRSRMFRSYAVILALAWGVEQVGRGWFGRPGRLPRGLTGLGAVGLMAGVLGLTWRQSSGYEGHLRPEVYPASTHPGDRPYRAEFADLTCHLAALAREGRPVLATLDPVLYSWWLTFTPGTSYLAEAFVSTATDREAQHRLAALAKLLGATPDEYVAFLQRRGTLWFWLGCVKYQASRAHAFAPLAQYDPAVQDEICAGSLYNNFNVALPNDEVARLRGDYLAPPPGEADRRELDIIVLTRDGPFAGTAPPVASWQIRFESPRFRVYTRRKG